MKTMNAQEIKKLLNTTKEIYDYTTYGLIYIAIFTGMRRGELLGLRWSDIDFKNKTASIQQTLQKALEGGYRFDTPKTKGSIRMISLPDSVVNILKKIKKEQAQNRLLLGESYKNEYNLVFTNTDGSPITPDAIRHRFNRVKEKSSIDVRFHDLRHTHATLMLEAGIHPKIVQERLGHSSITITMDTYSHVLPSLQKEAVEKLEKMLQSSSNSI
ncbi:site-specific integrase [Anoxybacter fermentans]|uniref:site-specific integrase n=1 Tax=Anoxybacter fermentans TaxID=1323375 RepID=UPI001F384066|nr:site-specific integrase [Anoxybacter fermentans]